MDHRSLAALTAAALLLQAYLLPGLKGAADPLRILARHEAARTAELRRLGIAFADGRTITAGVSRPGLLNAVAH